MMAVSDPLWWEDLPELRHLDDVRLRWIAGYWDGPLSGVAVHQQTLVWFSVVSPDGWRHRDYGLYRVEPAERDELERRHQLFVTHVGAHMDVTYPDQMPIRDHRTVRPQAEHHRYYNLQRTWKPLQIEETREPYARFAIVPSPHRRRNRSRRWWARTLGTTTTDK